jgi:hypothetical protein
LGSYDSQLRCFGDGSLSIGIEHFGDLIVDRDQALTAIAEMGRALQ